MSIFKVAQSQQGTVASSPAPRTVDIGISSDGLMGVRSQHAGVQVTDAALASEQAIDNTVNRHISQLEELRWEAKELLRSLQR